jgi:hypothetical protein
MVETINPVVYGRRIFGVAITAYGLGLVIGAVSLGMLLAWVSSLVAQPRILPIGLAAFAMWASLADLGILPMAGPQTRWQVPRRLTLLAPWQSGFLFGLGLGPGITSRTPTAAFYVALVGTVALGLSVAEATAVFVAYAVGRWLAVLIPAALPAQGTQQVEARVVRAFKEDRVFAGGVQS